MKKMLRGTILKAKVRFPFNRKPRYHQLTFHLPLNKSKNVKIGNNLILRGFSTEIDGRTFLVQFLVRFTYFQPKNKLVAFTLRKEWNIFSRERRKGT